MFEIYNKELKRETRILVKLVLIKYAKDMTVNPWPKVSY